MHGEDERVIHAFIGWLEGQKWSACREVAFADVKADCDGETLASEAKGRTSSIGLDVDSLYDQLLRCMRVRSSFLHAASQHRRTRRRRFLRSQGSVRERRGGEHSLTEFLQSEGLPVDGW